MISISTYTANVNGTVLIEESADTELKTASARVSQVATLDGNSTIVHKGFSHGDRTFFVRADIDPNQDSAIWDIFKNESLVYIATAEGFFSGAVSYCNITNNKLIMNLLIKEKLD